MARLSFKPGAVRTFVTTQARKEVRACTAAVNRKARRNAPGGPYSTGRLKRSINWSVQTAGWNVRGRSGSELIYAYSVHEGQPARRITAKRYARLRFYWRRVGRIVTPYQVNHPGTAPQPYLVQALLTEAPQFGLFGFKVVTYH
jgi:hypothetical protein